MKRLKTKGMEVERRSRSRERRRRGSGEYQQPQDPRLQVFSSIPHFRSDRKVLLSPQPPQGKGDGSYNNGGNYRHQDDGEASGGEDDKKINQGEI